MAVKPTGELSTPLIRLEDDAMDLDAEQPPVQAVAKRTFWEMSNGAPSASEGPSVKRARNEAQKIEDPARLIAVDVQIGEEEYITFQVPILALFNLAPDYFLRMFGHSLRETRTQRIRLVDNPYIHPQAAAQVFLHAQCSVCAFKQSEYRSLAQLKSQCPEEFEHILNDILRLRTIWQTTGLDEQLEQFLSEELSTDLPNNFNKYFQWAMSTPGAAYLFENALEEIACGSVDVRLQLYSLFTDVYQGDYSQCTEDEKRTAQSFVRQCFDSITNVDEKGDDEINALCQCFVTLYPDFDISCVVQLKMLAVLQPKKELSAWTYYICNLCECLQCYSDHLDRFDYKKAIRVPSLRKFVIRPEAPDSLKIYESLLQVMFEPTRHLDTFLTQYPENICALQLRALFHYRNHNYDPAIVDLDEVLRILPVDPIALRGRAMCRKMKKDMEGALRDLDTLVAFYPKPGSNHLLRATFLFEHGKFEDSIADVESAFRSGSLTLVQRAEAYATLGKCFEKTGNLDKAFENYDLAIESFPMYAEGWKLRGGIHLVKMRIDEAWSDFNHAITISPGFAAAIAFRGHCHALKLDFTAAAADFEASLKIIPDHGPTLSFKGKSLLLQGKLSEALSLLDEALKKSPKLYSTLLWRGECLLRMERWDEAIPMFDQVLIDRPKDVRAHAFRGECRQRQENYLAALEDYDCALDLIAQGMPTEELNLEAKKEALLKILGEL